MQTISAQPQPTALPKPGQRWTAGRKAAVVSAINDGHLTAQEACDRYGMDRRELARWFDKLEHGGIESLKVRRETGVGL
jgi:transposase-like protein